MLTVSNRFVLSTFEMSKPALLVAEPKLIRSILVKDSHIFTNRRDFGDIMDEVGSKFLFMMRGDAWRRVRNILSVRYFKLFLCAFQMNALIA